MTSGDTWYTPFLLGLHLGISEQYLVYFVPFGASFKDLRGDLVYFVPFGASFGDLRGYLVYEMISIDVRKVRF